MNRILYFIIILSTPIAAKTQSGKNWYYYVDEQNLAIRGYDLVSFFSESGTANPDGPSEGLSSITFVHEGITYRFADENNRLAFSKNPNRYLSIAFEAKRLKIFKF